MYMTLLIYVKTNGYTFCQFEYHASFDIHLVITLPCKKILSP